MVVQLRNTWEVMIDLVDGVCFFSGDTAGRRGADESRDGGMRD